MRLVVPAPYLPVGLWSALLCLSGPFSVRPFALLIIVTLQLLKLTIWLCVRLDPWLSLLATAHGSEWKLKVAVLLGLAEKAIWEPLSAPSLARSFYFSMFLRMLSLKRSWREAVWEEVIRLEDTDLALPAQLSSNSFSARFREDVKLIVLLKAGGILFTSGDCIVE